MLDPKITSLNKEQEDNGGIVVSRLKPGTRIVVKTMYSTYEMTVIEGSKVWVKGGKYFPEFVERYFVGSTWGGSCLKLHWIGQDMQMEFTNPPRGVRTSRVQSATVIGDGWTYEMDWNQS